MLYSILIEIDISRNIVCLMRLFPVFWEFHKGDVGYTVDISAK